MFVVELTAIDIKTSFNIILDFEFLKNIDGVVEHVAIESDSRFMTNVSPTNFSIFSRLIDRKDEDLKTVMEFDFMGNNDFEMVKAYLYYRKKNFEIYAGKLENLVSTTEKSLNYDGYSSSGGIQTGADANQRQLQFGYIFGNFRFSLAITDELPTCGSNNDTGFYMNFPAIESSIYFKNEKINSKISIHLGKINIENNDGFTSFLVMNEINLRIKDFLLKLSAFYSSAGSQFFVVDEMIDFFLLNNSIITEKNFGGFIQLIYEREKFGVWSGVGLFDTTSGSVEKIKALQNDFMISNIRISLGVEYEFLKNTIFAFEYSRFITNRYVSLEEQKCSGDSFHFQMSINF